MKSKLFLGTIVFFVCATAQETSAQRNKKNKKEAFATTSSAEAKRTFAEGEKFYILEDYNKALFYFQQSIEYDANNAAAYYKVAEIFFKSIKEDDLVRATENIENALRIEKKNKYYYQLASHIYIARRQLDKAAQAIETMLKEVDGASDNLFELAAIYLQNQQLDEALKTYDLAEADMGVNEISSLQKQRIYALRGKWNNAIEEGQKLIQAYPDEERYVLAQAELFSQQSKLNQSIDLLEDFSASHTDAASTKMMLASLYREAGQEKKSRDFVIKLMEDPDVEVSSKVLMLSTYNAALAQAQNKKMNTEDLQDFTLQLFKKLKSNYPNDAEVCLVGGDLFLRLSRNQEALAEYSQAVRMEENHLGAWQNLLYLETQFGMADSLIAHSEKALEIFPNQMIIYYFNGIGHLQKKNFKNAIQIIEESKRISTTNKKLQSEMYGMLGDAYNATYDNEKSDKAYEEALAINPNNDYVLNNYSYFLSLRKINLEKAEKMSAQSLKNQPENAAFIDTYAWILYQLGRYMEAKKTIEKIVLHEKASGVNYEHYGDILYQLGEVDEAVVQWQKAKSGNGGSEELNKKITNRKIY